MIQSSKCVLEGGDLSFYLNPFIGIVCKGTCRSPHDTVRRCPLREHTCSLVIIYEGDGESCSCVSNELKFVL